MYDHEYGLFDETSATIIIDLHAWLNLEKGPDKNLDWLVLSVAEPSAREHPDIMTLAVIALNAYKRGNEPLGRKLVEVLQSTKF